VEAAVRQPSSLALLTAATGLAACIQGSPDQHLGTEDVVARHVGREAPTPAHRVGARFGDSAELVGYDLEPATFEPGETVRVTWHWRSIGRLEEGHEIFTHLVDAETGRMCRGGNFDTASVDGFRRLHPPSRWEPGTYIRDVQRIAIPEDVDVAEAELRIGLFRGSRRLPIADGPRDDQNRARGPRFETGFRPPPVAELRAVHVATPIEVDGRLDETAWQAAAWTAPFANATSGEPDQPRTTAKLLFDAEHLFVAFECEDDHLHSTFTRRDDHLWKQDAVEVFVDPAGRGRDYFEVQVSPAGLLFDTKVHEHPRRDDGWDARARVAVTKRGTLNDDGDRDEGWTVELAIPFATLGGVPAPEGASWRVNLFRLDTMRNGRRAFLGWSPPLANTTHVPARFGKIAFPGTRGPADGPGGEAAAPANGADGAPGEGSP
jgi:hypothetical protein